MAKRIEVADDEAGLAVGEVTYPIDLPPAESAGEAARARYTALDADLRARLRGFLLKRGAGDFVDDLIQDTLRRVFAHGGRFTNEPALHGFVLRVAENVWKTWYGQQKRQAVASGGGCIGAEEGEGERATPLETALSVEPVALTRLLDEEQRRLLRQAIETLPPKGRRCVMLRVYHERSIEEIANLLRISVGAVKAHLHQSKEKLAAKLGSAAQELQL